MKRLRHFAGSSALAAYARLAVSAVLLGMSLVACTDQDPAPAPASRVPSVAAVVVVPAVLSISAGEDAWLAAEARDAAGQPVGGASLHFRAEQPEYLRVGDNGRVSALGRAVERTWVRVSSGAREARVPVSVRPGAPHSVEVLGGGTQQVVAGDAPSEPVRLRVLDRWDNPLPGVELRAVPQAGTDPSKEDGALARALPPIRTDTRGIAQLTLPVLPQTGTLELQFAPVAASDVEADRIAAASTAVATVRLEVRPGAAAALALSLAAPVEDAAAQSARALEARVRDAVGNGVPGVELAVFCDGAAEPCATGRTNASGMATLTLAEVRAPPGARLRVVVKDDPSVGGELQLPPAPAAPRKLRGARQSP